MTLTSGMEVTFCGCINVRVRLTDQLEPVLLSGTTYQLWEFEVLGEIPKGYILPSKATYTAFKPIDGGLSAD